MKADGKRFCTYCRQRKPAVTFVEIRDRRGLLRNRKCGDCAEMQKKSIAEREAHEEKRREERKAAEAKRMTEVTKAREKRGKGCDA